MNMIDNQLDSFLNFNSNDTLMNLSNSDRIHLMNMLRGYYLKLRTGLNLDDMITFGVEIEFEEYGLEKAKKEIEMLNLNQKWSVLKELSLINGGEVISPVLHDTIDTWEDLDMVCKFLSTRAIVFDTVGGHIHIGMHILGNNPKYWGNFIKLWITYENILFRFLYGEYISPRDGILQQARPIASEFMMDLDRINDRMNMNTAFYMMQLLDAGDDFTERRKRSVNFTNVSKIEPYKYNSVENKNTIEFRSPNGSFDAVIWQNNINLLCKLFLYAKRDDFDEDLINSRMYHIMCNGIDSDIVKYGYIYNEQAIELADLIFDNNLDKIYFLRQYFKCGDVSSKPLVKSKKFTIYNI